MYFMKGEKLVRKNVNFRYIRKKKITKGKTEHTFENELSFHACSEALDQTASGAVLACVTRDNAVTPVGAIHFLDLMI